MSLEWRQAVSANCGSKNSWLARKSIKQLAVSLHSHVKCIYIPLPFVSPVSHELSRRISPPFSVTAELHHSAHAHKHEQRKGNENTQPPMGLGIIICKLPHDIISFLRVYNLSIATQMECRLWKVVFLRRSLSLPLSVENLFRVYRCCFSTSPDLALADLFGASAMIL